MIRLFMSVAGTALRWAASLAAVRGISNEAAPHVTVPDMLPRVVPSFPEFRAMTSEDVTMLADLFTRYPSEVSERTVGSLHVWRRYGGRSQLSELEGHLLISWYRDGLGRLVFPPVGPDPASAIVALAEDVSKGASIDGVYGLTEPLVSQLRESGLTPLPLRDEWDYVYSVEDLSRLEGPRYHTQRKELKKASSEHDLRYEPMTEEHRAECLELEDTWCDMKHCTMDEFSAAEDAALKEALVGMREVALFGGVAYADGKLEALTIGERLNPSTAVVHFEKANPAIRGMYQFINQQFCQHALAGYEFVNREQDMGEPGLRRAKEGYQPHHFVEKHVLRLR